MPCYSLYGFAAECSERILGLSPIPTTHQSVPGLEIRFRSPLDGWDEQGSALPGRSIYASPDVGAQGRPLFTLESDAHGALHRLRFADDCDFELNTASGAIRFSWPNGLSAEDALTYLLGPVFGIFLTLRKIVSLHGSAALRGDKAFVLTGGAGSGKSTTIAALARTGYPIMADDIAALNDLGDRFQVRPAYPHIRLWPESVEFLFGSRDALPKLVPSNPTWDKRYLDLTQPGYRFQDQPVELGAVYLLGERQPGLDRPSIEPVKPAQALIELVANTYAARLLNQEQRAHEFDVLGRLVRHVPVKRLALGTDLACLERLGEVIEQDLGGG